MIERAGFLRTAILAPLAALLGCKRKGPPIHMDTSEPAKDTPIRATAWTITTTSNGTDSTAWINAGDGRWYKAHP